MRDYGQVDNSKWTDFTGRVWPRIASKWSLKFSNPSHAALRAHVFRMAGFKCARCTAVAVNVPANYSGRSALSTNTRIKSGGLDVLVLDHILTRKAGGLNVVENLQALCETCNKKKQKDDIAAAVAYRGTNDR